MVVVFTRRLYVLTGPKRVLRRTPRVILKQAGVEPEVFLQKK